MQESVYIFSPDEEKLISDAIKSAEDKTSGEIRVHFTPEIESTNILEEATKWFNQLKMFETKDRNAVLILVAHEDNQFAIIGDIGIHEKVGQEFWDSEKQVISSNFKKGRMALGLIEAIIKIGDKLKIHFPYENNDINELSDDISYG